MVTIGMNYKVVPGKDEEFVSVFTKVMGIMEEIDGHTRTHLFRDVHNEHDYLVLSEWADKGAFDDFIASERFKNVVTWTSPSCPLTSMRVRGRSPRSVTRYGLDWAP